VVKVSAAEGVGDSEGLRLAVATAAAIRPESFDAVERYERT